MMFVVTIVFIGILGYARAEDYAEDYAEYDYVECPGNQQSIKVPIGYDMEVPENVDGSLEKITTVHLTFEITQLKMVQEDRLPDPQLDSHAVCY